MKSGCYCLFFIMLIWSGAVIADNNNGVTIGFVGDIMLGRLVNEQLKKQQSYDYPWGNMQSLLQANDFNIGNLETAITAETTPVPKVFNFRSEPDHVNVLKKGHIDIVSLANNHALDFGRAGLLDMLTILKNAGIKHVGAGATIAKAREPVIMKKKKLTFGVIGFTDNEPTWLATSDKPGTNYIKVGDIATVTSMIKNMKDRVDVVIATIHWGPNMRQRPSDKFVRFAHDMIDAGIDIIHGHSAHIFQGIEFYKNKLIMYDTGDFIDDYRVDPVLRNNISFLFQVTIDRDGIQKLQLLPVKISNMQVNRATEKDASWAIKRMQMLSKEFGTTISDEGVWQR